MHSLERTVAEFLEAQSLVRPGEKGLVSVSGGADSVALLRVLAEMRSGLGLTLEIVHFDHGLRAESPEEGQWVRQLAEQLGLPFHLRHTDGLAGLNSGVQAAARAWREEGCRELMAQTGAAWTATGHQRDDQTETRLLKLMRGCHLTAIKGMEPRRGLFIRPLLPIFRTELEAYLNEIGQGWLEDPSNRKPVYLRNRVRLELLPLLNDLTGGAVTERLEALEQQSRRLEQAAENFPPPPASLPDEPHHWISVPELAALPLLAREVALHRFVQARLPGAVDRRHVTSALRLIEGGGTSWCLHLPGKRQLKRQGQRLLLAPLHPPKSNLVEHRIEQRTLNVPAELPLAISTSGPGGLALYNLPSEARLDVRFRLPGDRFHPPWRNSPVKVKDFLRDQRVPLWLRDRLPLVIWQQTVVAILPLHAASGHHEPRGETPPLLFDFKGFDFKDFRLQEH